MNKKTITSKELFNVVFDKQRKIATDAIGLSSNDSNFGSNMHMALTLQVNAESFGFTFSTHLLAQLSNSNEQAIVDFWQQFSPIALKAVGGHCHFKPMYPNFPQQVLDAFDAELLTNALVHYAGSWVGLRILPQYKEDVRLPLLDKVEPKVIDAASIHDVESLFINLISANTSLSVSDKESVKTLFNYFNSKGNVTDLISKSNIAQKENLAFIGALILNSNLDFNELLAHRLDTPTDLLRLSAAMFNGDTSLSQATKVGKMSRPMRKAFLSTLERQFTQSNDSQQLLENMFTYREMWIRLGYALHPGEHVNKFPLTSLAFDDLRSKNKPVTFNSKIEKLMQNNDVTKASQELMSRPGVFARNINRLLGIAKNPVEQNDILNKFQSCANHIATPVLLQLYSHFLHQHKKAIKTFMPKGGLSKLYTIDNHEDAIDLELANKVSGICDNALSERFKHFPSLGKVYIDPALKDQNVPFAQRSASKALNTVARGSRFEAEKSEFNTIRLFIWWNENGLDKNGSSLNVGRVDIDLSCLLMDEKYNTVDVCSYWDLRGQSGAMAHSGDIVSAPKGACEFIDIDLDKIDKNIRYVVMTISSYTQQKYCDLPECFAGWMMRDKPQSGQIFDARTVKNKIDLTSDSTQMMPAIFDTKTRQFIWADMAVKSNDLRVNNVAQNMTALAHNVKGLTNMIKPNLFDLFMMHAKSRGEITNNKEDADTVFSLNEGITPYMFDTIASQFMANEPPIVENKLKHKM